MIKPKIEDVMDVIQRLCDEWEYPHADLTMNHSEQFYIANGKAEQYLKEANKILIHIYEISHIIGDCKNPHHEWRKRFYELKKEFNKRDKAWWDRKEIQRSGDM